MIRAVRGMRDVLPRESRLLRGLQRVGRETAELFGYGEVCTPLVEPTELFARCLGGDSDVVSKEMYSFPARSGGGSLTLRPEGTAGVARCLLSAGPSQRLQREAARLWYTGPMFRHERPQRGRQRQFQQLGVERVGGHRVGDALSCVAADVEVLEMAHRFLRGVGVPRGVLQLHINSLGSREDREKHAVVLGQYLRENHGALSEDSRQRLERGAVLRVLDSKSPQDQEIISGAPPLEEHLSAESAQRFALVLEGLRAADVDFVCNPRLVRGLDYYTHTCFEFVWSSATSGQNAVLAGGRYDGLLAQLEGSRQRRDERADTPAVGWACGLERLLLLLQEECPPEVVERLGGPPAPKVGILQVEATQADRSQELRLACRRVAGMLRDRGVNCVEVFDGGVAADLRKQLRHISETEECTHAVLVGEEEWSRQEVSVKDLLTREQRSLPLAELGAHAFTPHAR